MCAVSFLVLAVEEVICQMKVRPGLNLTHGVTNHYFIEAIDLMLTRVCMRKDKE